MEPCIENHPNDPSNTLGISQCVFEVGHLDKGTPHRTPKGEWWYQGYRVTYHSARKSGKELDPFGLQAVGVAVQKGITVD